MCSVAFEFYRCAMQITTLRKPALNYKTLQNGKKPIRKGCSNLQPHTPVNEEGKPYYTIQVEVGWIMDYGV